MAVGGDDDTLAGSVPTQDGSTSAVTESELVGGRYRIIRWLGGGGMGRVYEALDNELDEHVALKVLRAGLSDEALERFRREVKLTRRIQHKNVARMFDIGEYKGEKFLTMELIDGEPLSRLIGKPMDWSRLKPIAEQLCAGLAAAHQAGVVHRDLKPDNVLIEAETQRIVITDFGIARKSEDPSVTQTGAIVGTPRYMAPEQLAGDEVDPRADLFSLGVMLFELATGTRPWPGDNAIAIAVSQATQPPLTIDPTTSQVPAAFASAIAACLQVELEKRPTSANEILSALTTGTLLGVATKLDKPHGKRAAVVRERAVPALSEPTSIAVLPVTCAPGDEYLADGILDDVTDTLSLTPGLRVRPSGAVRSATAPDPRALGERLGVDHVVVTSMRRTHGGLRITTRLINIADGFQIWAHKTDCSEAEVLEVSEDLARGIADALSTRATSVTKPTDPRAVDLYLRARAELRRFWGTHVQTAARLLEQAVAYAPTSAPILAAHAYASVQAWVMRGEPELLPRAREALERALATGHGEAYLASAQYNFNRGDLERGAVDLAKALVRAPMSAQTHELAGKILLEIEGASGARQHFETARGLDPGRAQIIEQDLARLDALERRWDEADARVAKLQADPDPSIQQIGGITNARLHAWRHDVNTLMQRQEEILARVTTTAGQVFRFVGAIQKHGGIDRPAYEKLIKQPHNPDTPVRQLLIRMQVFCELALVFNERELALDALERAVELGLMDVAWIDGCPLIEKIVNHHRYPELRRRIAARAERVLAAFRSVATNP